MTARTAEIGDHVEAVSGPAFKSARFTDDPLDVPLIKGENIAQGHIAWEKSKYWPIGEAEEYERFGLVAGDIVLAMDRPWVTAGLKWARLKPHDPPSLLVQRVARLRARPGLRQDFLTYVIGSPAFSQYVRNIMGGTNVPHISGAQIKAFKFRLPGENEQAAIADILTAYDDLIENNRRRIALLEEAARLLYREWFVHFRYPGHEHVKIIDGLPEGWERRYLGDVVTTQYGHTASASDEEVGPKFVRGTDINKRSFIDWSSVPYCPEQGLDFNKYALIPGDILVIRMADPGKVALVEKSIRAVFASYLVRLKIRNPNKLPPIYLFMTLMEERYQGFIGSSSGGATRKSASAKLLTDFHFAQPPKVLLKLFIEQVAPMREMITKLVDQSSGAAQARDLLLPRLMNGEIAV